MQGLAKFNQTSNIMKHQDYIERFVCNCDEFDGYCYVFWLPGEEIDGILPEPRTDMLGVYLDREDGFRLSFLLSSEDDRDQIMASFGELPYHVQKELVLFFHQYRRVN